MGRHYTTARATLTGGIGSPLTLRRIAGSGFHQEFMITKAIKRVRAVAVAQQHAWAIDLLNLVRLSRPDIDDSRRSADLARLPNATCAASDVTLHAEQASHFNRKGRRLR